jgi:hypothetical protein
MPVSLVTWEAEQEDPEFKVSLGKGVNKRVGTWFKR